MFNLSLPWWNIREWYFFFYHLGARVLVRGKKHFNTSNHCCYYPFSSFCCCRLTLFPVLYITYMWNMSYTHKHIYQNSTSGDDVILHSDPQKSHSLKNAILLLHVSDLTSWNMWWMGGHVQRFVTINYQNSKCQWYKIILFGANWACSTFAGTIFWTSGPVVVSKQMNRLNSFYNNDHFHRNQDSFSRKEADPWSEYRCTS